MSRQTLEQIAEVCFSAGHPSHVTRHRMAVISGRVQLFASAFIVPTLLWIILDANSMETASWHLMALLRVLSAAVLLILSSVAIPRLRSRGEALGLLALMLACPMTIFVAAQFIAAQPLNGALALINHKLYEAIPLLVLAGIGVFPLVVSESLLLGFLVIVVAIVAPLSQEPGNSPHLISLFLTDCLVLGVYVLAGAIQVFYMASLMGQADRDPLTGVWNRGRMEERAREELLRWTRYGHPVSLVFADIDHFKKVNDSFGHAIGDDVLKEFCGIVRRCMRSTDLFGRWGGEEFVIVLPNSGLTIARLLAERIRVELMEHHFAFAESITASFGIAECRPRESWESWLARADAATYRAKNNGRNQLAWDAVDEGSEVMLGALDARIFELIWRKQYECGHQGVDDQHRQLFYSGNDLLNAVISGRPKAEITAMIETLLGDITEHFYFEEAVFRAIGFPDSDSHDAIHQHLLGQTAELKKSYEQGNLALGDLFNFLAYDVVVQHILIEDRKYFPYLQVMSSMEELPLQG